MKNNAKQPHIEFAILATDIAIFTVRSGKLLVRLMNVDRPPYFVNVPGLPGGLLLPDETTDETAVRIVNEKAMINIEHMYVEQFATFSRVDRDPRGRVVAVGYVALVPWEELSATEQTNTSESWWQAVEKMQSLAYDHNEMLASALKHIRSRISLTTISSKLLPKEFTLTELESTMETVLGKDIDKRNFRKKIIKIKIVKKLDRERRGMKHRPASLYSFVSNKVKDIEVL